MLLVPQAGRRYVNLVPIPFTGGAEKMSRRIEANVIALGALAVVTGVVKPESIVKAIPSRLPERNAATALAALDVGVKLAEGATVLS